MLASLIRGARGCFWGCFGVSGDSGDEGCAARVDPNAEPLRCAVGSAARPGVRARAGGILDERKSARHP